MDKNSLVFDVFLQGLLGHPKSDVLRFKNDDYRIIIRPSGTEPKMKIYLQAKGVNKEDAAEKIDNALRLVESLIRL